MDGVGSVSFIRWNVSERRNVRVRDDVSVQKERWVWYDDSSQWRETLYMYLFERSDFWWLWLESLSSSSFISFWEIPIDESKSLTRWNCDEKCDRIRSSDRSGYHIVSMIFDFFWNRGHHMIPFWLDYFRVCDHGCQDEIQRHGNMYPLILQTIWTCSPYP